MTEQAGIRIFSEIMSVPHGKLDKALETHAQCMKENPLFYAQMATWYSQNGTVRDQKIAFVRTLFDATNARLREVGWSLLQNLPFFMVSRLPSRGAPRTMRSAIVHYLATMREDRLNYQILRGAKELKRVVRRYHVPTSNSASENLQKIGRELFENRGEIRKVYKQLRDATTGSEVAEILRRVPIPAYIAISSIPVRTPEIMSALIGNMTPSELLQSLNSLGRMKAIRPNIGLILNKIERAIDDRRISGMRIHRISRMLDREVVPQEVFDLLSTVTVRKLRKRSKIKGNLSIHIDASGSMSSAIEVGRQLATTLSIACEKMPSIYTACQTPTKINVKEATPESWEQAFSLIQPGGMTPLGAGIAVMRTRAETPDAIIIITDEAENQPPIFAQQYKTLDVKPKVIILNVDRDARSSPLRDSLNRENIHYEQLHVNAADQYALDQIVSLIGKASPFETVLEIMSMDLPERPAETKVKGYWK